MVSGDSLGSRITGIVRSVTADEDKSVAERRMELRIEAKSD